MTISFKPTMNAKSSPSAEGFQLGAAGFFFQIVMVKNYWAFLKLSNFQTLRNMLVFSSVGIMCINVQSSMLASGWKLAIIHCIWSICA